MPIWEWQSGKFRESGVGGGAAMKESARYVNIVEWSEEDQCFVGSCPGMFYRALRDSR